MCLVMRSTLTCLCRCLCLFCHSDSTVVFDISKNGKVQGADIGLLSWIQRRLKFNLNLDIITDILTYDPVTNEPKGGGAFHVSCFGSQ